MNGTITNLSLPYPDKADRLVRVYVPDHADGETLPVIYMTDGQNLFDEETSTYGCWHIPETLEKERTLSAESAIIVGIHSPGHPVERTNELTPKSIGEVIYPSDLPPELKEDFTPEGEIFDGFLVDTVMPAVEALFPVRTGRENTAICGSSSGGLQAFFTAVTHPDLFCAAGALSPAFVLYPSGEMRRYLMTLDTENPPYLYIYTGAGDKLERQIYDSVELTYDMLLETYPPEKLNEVILPDEKHHESAWEPIFGDFLHTFLARRGEF